MSNSVQPHRRQPTRLPRPWDSPGKNTGVGCHFLLQCMKGKSESEVAQSCLTLTEPMDCSLPGSSIHGIFQARVLEWGAIAFSDYYALDPQKWFFFLWLKICTLWSTLSYFPLPSTSGNPHSSEEHCFYCYYPNSILHYFIPSTNTIPCVRPWGYNSEQNR